MTDAITIVGYLRTKPLFGEMQLQKLLYYTQGWSLAWTGRPLFAQEIEAWKDGPVVRQVWAAGRYDDYVIPTGDEELTEAQKAIVDAVYAFYGPNGGRALSIRTHAEVPWLEARGDTPDGAASTQSVSQATMRRFFSQVALDGEEAPTAPTLSSPANDERVLAAGARQASRWRGALDALALR